jgi:hypothetical protein
MACYNEDIDNGYITNVLQQWGCKLDDEELVSVAVSSKVSDDFVGPNFIPEPPRTVPSLKLATKDPLLQSLMRRYQKFVPASLPIRKRMSRPVCLFVNFMGTRTENSNSEVPLAKKPCQITAEKDGSNSVSAYPSDIPAGRRPASVRPQKRQKVSRKKDSNPKRNREISPLSHHFDR